MPPDTTRHVVLVTYPGCQALDVAGPHEVFVGAAALIAHGYHVDVASNGGGPIATESGLTIGTVDLAVLDRAPDTVLVVGGNGVHAARSDDALVGWIRDVAPSARRMGSVCSGAFLLGEAGLLAQRRVATHWARAARLADEFPTAEVDADAIYVHDGVWTSAGVTAGIDLALAMVEDDHGVDCAQTIAQWLVMFLRRPGGQSQFAAPVWQRPPDHRGVRAAVDAVRGAPAAEHSVRSMARVAAMSPRNFTRVFTRELGVSPGRFVERVRVDAARHLLESTALTTEAVATACGFGTAETMRRTFIRSIGTPPGAYRHRFSHHSTRRITA